jgi:predicted O-methyltransferase YrrM
MAAESWERVDLFLEETLGLRDPVLDAVLTANARAGLPAIDVSPAQGALLMLLAQLTGARRVLEIGTLGGYSTIWLARGMPEDARIVTLEVSAHHAATARANLERAGVADRVDIRVAPALESLEALLGEGAEPFDLVFIDADKPNNPSYVEAAIALSRPGTVLLVDNVIRSGAVVDGPEPSSAGSRDALALLGRDPRVDATALQTVGRKGWDGFALARVR